jgi:hypothetical protein
MPAMLRALMLPLLLLLAAADAPRPVFPAGSAFGLVPPPGYRPSQRFIGFEKIGEGGIVFVELPPEAFSAMREGLNKEALAARGMQEISRREVPLPGRAQPALLIEAKLQVGQQMAHRWLLVVPDGIRTGLITATLPGNSPTATRTAVEKALLSVAMRAEVGLEEQRSTLPFRFVDRPGLKLQRVVAGGAAILSSPGAPFGTKDHLEWPSMVLAAGAGPPVAPDQLAANAIAALHGVGALHDLTITDAPEETRYAGQPAILVRAEASGPTPGSKLRIAQWLAVLPNGGRLAAIAQAPSAAFDAAWPDFKAVAESVEAR